MGAYLPGYRPDMARMLAARTAAERAALLLPRLTAGMRLQGWVDVVATTS